jgi:hypothetical protein
MTADSRQNAAVSAEKNALGDPIHGNTAKSSPSDIRRDSRGM